MHNTLLGLFIVSDCTSVSEHLCHCVELWCLVDMDSMGMSVGQRTLLERHECVSPFVHRRIHPQRVRDNRRHALAPPHAPEAVRYTNLMRWFISRQALPCTNHRLRKVFPFNTGISGCQYFRTGEQKETGRGHPLRLSHPAPDRAWRQAVDLL